MTFIVAAIVGLCWLLSGFPCTTSRMRAPQLFVGLEQLSSESGAKLLQRTRLQLLKLLNSHLCI